MLYSSHWYLAIICNLHNLERKFEVDTATPDSDGTSVEEPATAVDPSTDKYSDASDIQLDSDMSVDKDEWPSEDGVERLDGKKEAKNCRAKLSSRDIGIDAAPDVASGNKSKAKRKSIHYVPPNTFVE